MTTSFCRRCARNIKGYSDDSTMIAFYPPASLAEEIASWSSLDRDPSELHLTLLYLGKLDERSAKQVLHELKLLAPELEAPELELDGSLAFTHDDQTVRSLLWNDFGLERVRVSVLDRMDSKGLLEAYDHGFIPHMTLEYHDMPEPLPKGWEQLPRVLTQQTWVPEQLKVMRGGEEVGSVEIG